MDIKILTDSTCDLPREVMEEYDISVIPLHINLGERSLLDGEEVTPQDIFAHVAAGGELPSTAAINLSRFQEAFAGYASGHDAVICITIGSGFSSCFQNASAAAGDFSNVYVVDSQNLSAGQGIAVLSAARMARQGLSPEEILPRLQTLISKIDTSFILDRLDYMSKSGRCSSVAALGANLLKLKPCIELKDGQMTVGKKYRGAMPKVMRQYVWDRLEKYEKQQETEVFVTHPPANPDALLATWEALAVDGRFHKIWDADAGCTVACHCGPNTIGIIFLPAQEENPSIYT